MSCTDSKLSLCAALERQRRHGCRESGRPAERQAGRKVNRQARRADDSSTEASKGRIQLPFESE